MTREAMYDGIEHCGPGVPVNAVGKVGCGHTIINSTYRLHNLLTASVGPSLLQAIHAIADRHKLELVGHLAGHRVGWYLQSAPVVAKL